MREGREASEAERWVERTRELDQDISDAWAVLRQARESGRLNLRRTAAARVDAAHGLAPLLARLEQAVADTRSMAGTIASRLVERRLGPGLPRDVARPRRARGRGGQRGRRRGHHAGARGPRVRRARVVPRRRRPTPRPVQGALIVNLRNILEAMDAVAEAQPVRVEARPAAALGGRRKSIA